MQLSAKKSIFLLPSMLALFVARKIFLNQKLQARPPRLPATRGSMLVCAFWCFSSMFAFLLQCTLYVWGRFAFRDDTEKLALIISTKRLRFGAQPCERLPFLPQPLRAFLFFAAGIQQRCQCVRVKPLARRLPLFQVELLSRQFLLPLSLALPERRLQGQSMGGLALIFPLLWHFLALALTAPTLVTAHSPDGPRSPRCLVGRTKNWGAGAHCLFLRERYLWRCSFLHLLVFIRQHHDLQSKRQVKTITKLQAHSQPLTYSFQKYPQTIKKKCIKYIQKKLRGLTSDYIESCR